MGSYYIRIDDSPDVRRKLLESSKAGLHVLKGYQDLKVIRSEKLTLMNDLRSQMKELNILLNRVDLLLPELTESEADELGVKPAKRLQSISIKTQDLQASKKPSKTVFIKTTDKTVLRNDPRLNAQKQPIALKKPILAKPDLKAKQKPQPMTELDKLKQALADVESKLDNL